MTAVFRKALRDSSKTILWLSIGLSVYALFIMAFYPTIYENQEKFSEVLKSYPEELMGAFAGGMDIENLNIADPAVYIQAEFGTWVMLILGAMVMVQAFNALSNAERDGTMDVLLALPVSRRDVLLARLLNTAVSIFLVLTACFVVLAASTLVIENFDVDFDKLAVGIYAMFFLLMAQAAFTYMLASLVPSSKRWAGAVAYALFFGSYLVYSFAGVSDVLEGIKPLLMFDYYSLGKIMNDGLALVDAAVLGGGALLCAGIAWWWIDHKEIGV